MIKHGLIYSPEHLDELTKFDLKNIDYDLLQEIIRHSVNVKEYFVANDPTENNIRKALNFGHTIGHAFESYAMQQNRPIQHGHAVAYGMIAELFLSEKKCNFPQTDLQNINHWLIKLYGKFQISEYDFDSLFEFMTHDKKNEAGRINFTLLSDIGKIEINQNCERELIYESLAHYVNL
jgi:3-dehydroquinate synthase